MERLRRIEGARVAPPDGAFYVLPDLSAYFGAGVEAQGFGPVPDADTLCRRACLSGPCCLRHVAQQQTCHSGMAWPWVA